MAVVCVNNAERALSNGILFGSLRRLFDRLKSEESFALPCVAKNIIHLSKIKGSFKDNSVCMLNPELFYDEGSERAD